jgi:hypothetical protein
VEIVRNDPMGCCKVVKMVDLIFNVDEERVLLEFNTTSYACFHGGE